MSERTASKTALMTATIRANDNDFLKPPIFGDSLASKVVTDAEREERYQRSRLAYPDVTDAGPAQLFLTAIASNAGALTLVLGRARYNEDVLEAALANDLSQYVIVGAGLDTFAWRRPELADRLKVFEVDHPASQADKLARITSAGLGRPDNLRFVECDFEVESVADALMRSDFDSTRPAFFSWLGVTFYLTRQAIESMLQAIRSVSVSGSELVFDYMHPDMLDPSKAPASATFTQGMVRAEGEPIISGFDDQTLGGTLAKSGFVLAEDMGREAQEERYFRQRNDGIHASEWGRFAQAIVQ